ncbi:site-specific DNA-methyltransferase [Ligilactobacillus agilis]|uniref:site-specific DNA-methyltransferase n=1 Tax=Ligilactobacillus agilis TaxID=1601 RepID=UPI0028CB8990|nr:site-specific DNA-methyltransferase [Ligilactobacillus agilis]
METKINQAIKSVLLMFDDKYFIGEIINKQKVIQDLDNYDKELMTKMLSNDVVKSNFTMAISDAIIFNVNKLVELFETNDYWQDSYTKYSKNRVNS